MTRLTEPEPLVLRVPIEKPVPARGGAVRKLGVRQRAIQPRWGLHALFVVLCVVVATGGVVIEAGRPDVAVLAESSGTDSEALATVGGLADSLARQVPGKIAPGVYVLPTRSLELSGLFLTERRLHGLDIGRLAELETQVTVNEMGVPEERLALPAQSWVDPWYWVDRAEMRELIQQGERAESVTLAEVPSCRFRVEPDGRAFLEHEQGSSPYPAVRASRGSAGRGEATVFTVESSEDTKRLFLSGRPLTPHAGAVVCRFDLFDEDEYAHRLSVMIHESGSNQLVAEVEPSGEVSFYGAKLALN